MSLWKRIVCSPEIEQSMKLYYDDKGLADIRVYFAQWIEERIMSERINTASTDVFNQIVQQFYDDLEQKLIVLGNDTLMKYKFAEICALVRQLPPSELYSHLRNGLQKEIQLLEQMPHNQYMCATAAAVGQMGAGMHSAGDELYTAHAQIQKLSMDIERVRQGIQPYRTECETFHIYLNEYNQNKAIMNRQVAVDSERKLEEKFSILINQKEGLAMEMRKIVGEYDIIQTRVIDELKNWQRNQALAGNGAQFRDNLDDIQRCIEMLVDIVCKILTHVNMLIVINIGENAGLSELLSHVRCAQEVLVLSAFIVEKQPPQVMKTNTRFAAAVRWLIGPQLGINMSAPTVECIILSEAQAQRHSAQRTMGEVSHGTPPSSGEILNNVGSMEYQQQTRVFSASFRNMQLKKIKRAEKKGTESVMDEKFALLFYTSSIVNDYKIRVWTLSLPVVVIVHGNQEPQSWATITWDNAFSDIVREPFQVPEKVSWSQLSLALNTKFASSTGRPLTEENMNFLYEKLFRNDGMGGDHKDYISWAQFCKEPLPDRSFTFWDWFFAIMKLTKDHLLGLWKAGLVVGFINKQKTTEEILGLTRAGTFLLRFSDSELGGITVAFVNDQGSVMMLSPWTARDLNIRGLADRVYDLTVLRYVYPTDRPKEEAYQEFYTQRIEEQTTRDGYVANTIKAHVPAIEGAPLITTPQHHMQSPNPQDMQMSSLPMPSTTSSLCCMNPYADDIDIYLNENFQLGFDIGVL